VVEPELPLVEGDGLIVPAEPVVPPLPTVPLELPPTPVLGALPLVLLPELEPARSSRRQSSFCVPVSASHLALVEPAPVLLLPALPLAPLLLPLLIPLLPLEPVLPDVCAIETVAAPTSAAATAAHRTFIVIVGLLTLREGKTAGGRGAKAMPPSRGRR